MVDLGRELGRVKLCSGRDLAKGVGPKVIIQRCINRQVVTWDISKYSDRFWSNNQERKPLHSMVVKTLPQFNILDSFHE